MHALIALGPGHVQIPCMIFNTYAEGQAFMEGAGLGKPRTDTGAQSLWMTQENDAVHNLIFSFYYADKGGVTAYVLKSIEAGKPIAAFCLD